MTVTTMETQETATLEDTAIEMLRALRLIGYGDTAMMRMWLRDQPESQSLVSLDTMSASELRLWIGRIASKVRITREA